MSVLKRVLLLILLLLVLLLAVLAYATMTHGGMKRLFSLGQSYAQGELSWGESSGRLLGPATLDDVVYATDTGASVEIQKARFDWQPRKLLSRTLQVDDFDLSGITIRLPPPSDEPEKETEPFQLRDLALPLGAEIQRVSLTDIKIYPYGSEEPVIVDAITLSAGGRDADLKLVELSINAPQGQFSMDGSVNTSGDWPIDLNQQWRVDHPQFGEYSGNGSMQGNIKSLRLQHTVAGAATIDIDTIVNDVTGELSWDGKLAVNSENLGVFSAGLDGIPVSVDALTSGELKAYQASGVVNSNLPQTGPLTADFNVGGSLDALEIKQVLVNLEQSTATATVAGNVQFAELQSDITVQWADVPWPLLVDQSLVAGDSSADRSPPPKPLALSPSGKITFSGKPDSFNVNLDSLLQQDTAGELQLIARLDGSPELINIQSVSVKSLQGSTDLDVTGVIDIQNNAVDIKGQWADLTWPLVDAENGSEKIVQSDAGNFSVSGPLDGYQVNAEVQLAGKDLPDGQWQLNANGNAESLSDIKLQGQTLDGVVNGSGTAQWSPATEWAIDLTADQINPAVKWPGLNGNVGLALQSVGSITDSGPAINVKILDLNGDYQKQALSGSGEINIVDGEVQIDRFDIKAGVASVSANGKLADTLNLDWKLDAPALDKLVPGISGDIDISGKIAGTVESPASDFSVDVKNFQSDGIEVKTINGRGSVDLSGKAQSTIKLNVNEITAAGQVWDKLVLEGSGSPEKHKVSVSLVGEQADLSLSANGSVQDAQWQGTLDQINIAKTAVGDWTLEQPVTITASAQQVEASRLCLVSDPSSLCVDGEWDAKKGAAADIELKELNAQRFKDYLPPDIEINAALQGTASVRTDASGAPRVTADFTIPGGSIDYLDTGEPVSDKLGQSRLQFELIDDDLKSKIDLDLGPIGTVNTNTIIGGLSTTKNLSGSVKTDIEDMSLVSVFMPDLQAVDGKFDTDMTLSGTLDSPQVVGETALNGLVTEVPAIAMKVLDGTMKVESDGKGGLNVTGKAISGDGFIDINGVMNPSTGDMELVIKGEQFEVANTARQRAVISPDLRVVINGSNITVTGEVHIPSAFIQAGGEDALVTESSDVIIVNSDEDAGPPKEESQVSLDVKVTLGDDIRVNAGPFDGALGGALTVQQVPGRVPTGSGAIEVLSGDFLVYGQKLTMEQGRILFGGGPIDNPALEIDVARDVVAYEVKAGARIRGTAQAPLLQLQSDPTQTDANTLSFILFGKPVGTVGASYTLGKFITPDLYVSYGIDLFDKIQSFNLRYKISERLSLIGARSDETQGADLIYRIER